MIMDIFGKKWMALVSSMMLAAQAASAYDLATEFSINDNPNGAWSYGYQASLNGNFTDLPIAVVNQASRPGWNHWKTATDAFLGVYKNAGTTNISSDGSFIPVGAAMLHPGADGQFAVARWTAPGPGYWRVFGSFRGDDAASTDVHIRLDGGVLLDGSITGLGQTNSFDFKVSTLGGETLDFLVGDGGNGNAHDSTGLAVTLVNAAILTIERDGDNVVLRWPTAANGFILEFNTSPNLPDEWLRSSDTMVEEGEFWKVTRPIGPDTEVFRLRREDLFPS